ncbi:transcriptional regulator [Paenibacillus sp. FSL R10-2771]|uniref:transcriptional regulator n=1 Tax=Paenibacillus sp. FSL R10-2771 TaxID=2954693 RepID=UPI0030FB819E
MMDKEILKLVGTRICALRKERGEKNVSLLNLHKIAESLEVNLVQLFAYQNEEFMVTSAESDIQDIVGMLREANDEKVRVAKNVLKELL